MMISRSHCGAAAVTTAAIRSGSSGSIGRQRASHPASVACAASISELVSRICPGPGSAPIGTTSSPVGRMSTQGTPPDGQPGRPGGGRRRHVDRPHPVPLRQQQLARADVLADRADVLVGRDGGAQLGPVVVVVHVLAHDHRVPAGRHRVAGVDHVVGARRQVRGRGLARAEGVRRADRDAVHPGRVERRRGPGGPDRGGGDQPRRLGDGDVDGRQSLRAARRLPGGAPGLDGLRGRHVADERAVGHGCLPVSRASPVETSPVEGDIHFRPGVESGRLFRDHHVPVGGRQHRQ